MLIKCLSIITIGSLAAMICNNDQDFMPFCKLIIMPVIPIANERIALQ